MMKLKNVISLSFMLLTLLACQKVDSTSSVNSSSASNNKVFQSKDEVNIKGEVNATLLEDGKTLQSIIRYHEDDDYIPEAEIEIHNMLVYWAVEASDSFETIKEYVDSNYIQMFEGYFDRCYREEMHACRTNVISYGNYEYISDVELNEEPGKYVIVKLKEDKREEHNSNMLYMIFIVGAVIGVLFIIAKLSEDKPKPIKY